MATSFNLSILALSLLGFIVLCLAAEENHLHDSTDYREGIEDGKAQVEHCFHCKQIEEKCQGNAIVVGPPTPHSRMRMRRSEKDEDKGPAGNPTTGGGSGTSDPNGQDGPTRPRQRSLASLTQEYKSGLAEGIAQAREGIHGHDHLRMRRSSDAGIAEARNGNPGTGTSGGGGGDGDSGSDGPTRPKQRTGQLTEDYRSGLNDGIREGRHCMHCQIYGKAKCEEILGGWDKA